MNETKLVFVADDNKCTVWQGKEVVGEGRGEGTDQLSKNGCESS